MMFRNFLLTQTNAGGNAGSVVACSGHLFMSKHLAISDRCDKSGLCHPRYGAALLVGASSRLTNPCLLKKALVRKGKLDKYAEFNYQEKKL